MSPVPELPHGCNSWTVVRRADGAVVGEFWSRSLIEKVNQDRYEVRTTLQHLQTFNAAVKVGAS